jgi:nuclear pore complex protein Nup62
MTQLNFRQLQELINKWTIDLGEQEKAFIEQATKVNAWDKTVMANGEKVKCLSSIMCLRLVRVKGIKLI